MEPICWKIEKVVSTGEYNYAIVRNHPKASKQGYVLMHRVVIENHLGRLLNSTEIVHHINHKKKDNRIENLEVMLIADHAKLHGNKQGKKFCHLKCPNCSCEFCLGFSQTHLGKKQGSFTCCSSSCKGKISRKIQLGNTQAIETALSENIVSTFLRFKGKSKVTVLQ